MWKHFLFASLTSACALAQAQWKLEPVDVFGIVLGKPIDASRIEDCVEPTATNQWKGTFERCRQATTSGGSFTMRNIDLPGVSTAWVGVDRSGLASSISIEFHHNYYREFKAALIERYGPPTSADRGKVTNMLGAVFDAEKSYWMGREISLILSERDDELDKSTVFFGSESADRLRRADQKAKTKAQAARF